MVSLTPEDKSRVRFHLNYSALDSIPDGDAMRLETAMDRIRDNSTANYIRFMLDALDDIFNNLMTGETFDSRQLIQGKCCPLA
ncbi:hypothetical protein [Chroococcidiopsis sp.]|uniref:hypothetical protein n=1 Tax=Chroococcidiopsis sp. TaxID=3088168 RepID=UPI003F2FB1C6